MAAFCWDAHNALFGNPEENDFVGLCSPGELVMVLCEGDGLRCPGYYHSVNHEGKRVGPSFDSTGHTISERVEPC